MLAMSSACSQCGMVSELVEVCVCARAWYCNADCQLKHWATHKPMCNICLHCDKAVYSLLHCSRCKKAKYCSAECSKAHWSVHKKDCSVAPK